MAFRSLLIGATTCALVSVGTSGCLYSLGPPPGPPTDTYVLVSIDGAPIPTEIGHGPTMTLVYSSELSFYDGNVCRTRTTFAVEGEEDRRHVEREASYTKTGDQLHLKWKGFGKTVGNLYGDTFVMKNEGRLFRYRRMAPPVQRAKTPTGVFDDFESELAQGKTEHDVPLGFFTFKGKASTTQIERTTRHPARPEESAGNHVLQLYVDGAGFSGFLHMFSNDALDQWVPLDWTEHTGCSFWVYGSNSGNLLFVDVLDNRTGYFTHDDAERYVFHFKDDFFGWKHMKVDFKDMERKDIDNRAVSDGLGLTEVHGWAFGVVNTGRRWTYYVDDFALY